MITDVRLHELKIVAPYYDDVATYLKSFELRKNDRDFRVNDILVLREWDGTAYTGNVTVRRVTYILFGGDFGLSPDYCAMSIRELTSTERELFTSI